MVSEQEYEQWQQLCRTIEESPQRYEVNSWQFRPALGTAYRTLDLWPLIKIAVSIRLAHEFFRTSHSVRHTGTGPAEKQASRVSGGRVRKWKNEFLNRHRRGKFAAFDGARRSLTKFSELVPAKPESGSAVFIGAGSNLLKVGDLFLQQHFDPIRAALAIVGIPSTSFVVDLGHGAHDLESTVLPGVYGFNEAYQAALKILPRWSRPDLAELPGFTAWWSEIATIYPVDSIVSPETIADIAVRTYSVYLAMRQVLERSASCAVFVYCYYSVYGYASSLAARDLAIPAFDIQHGIAGPKHYCYHWPGSPPNGYDTTPNGYLCWADGDASAVQRGHSRRSKAVLTVGHSWRLMEHLLCDPRHKSLFNGRVGLAGKAFREALEGTAPQTQTNISSRSVRILIAPQREERMEWLPELVACAPNEYVFSVRLHPGEWRNGAMAGGREELRKLENVDIDWASSTPMPGVLAQTDILVCRHSAAVLDARAYGVSSVCYSLAARWFFGGSEYQNVSVVRPTAAELLEAIKRHAHDADLQRTVEKGPDLETIGCRLKNLIT